jgi:hypothetical protein
MAGINTNTIILAVVAILALSYFGVLNFAGASAGGNGGNGNTIIASSQNLYVNGVDYAQGGVAVTTTSAVYEGSSLLKSSLAAGTAQPVSANAQVRVFSNSSGYFADEQTVNTGSDTVINVVPEMADDTTATITVLNPGTYTTNAAAAMAAFGASDQKTFEISVAGATNKYLTHPAINKVVFSLTFPTASEWAYTSNDDTYVEYGNAKCARATIPTSASGAQVSFECPMQNGGTGTAPYKYYLTMKASGTGGAAANTTLTMSGFDLYRNSVTGMTEQGVDNNLGVALHTNSTATVFTS